KEEVIRLIDEQGKLTEELAHDINAASQLQRVEDLYRPYKQKRRTRTTIAKEKGLEPIAESPWQQETDGITAEAVKYLSEDHDLHTSGAVLVGVNDIIAEWISDDPQFREFIREETFKRGLIHTEVKDAEKDEKRVYEMYYDYNEAVRSIASHRILAMNRGEKEDVLKIAIEPPVERIIEYLQKKVITKRAKEDSIAILQGAIEDGYKRLIQPS